MEINKIRKSRFYYSLLINSNRQYNFNVKNLEHIIAVLNKSRYEMKKPLATHLYIPINSNFDIKKLIPKIKRQLKDININYVYSIEKAETYHIHLMLVMDYSNMKEAEKILNTILVPAIKKMDDVRDCKINQRQCDKKTIFHNLKKVHEFYDAVDRYSYLAKTKSKDYVHNAFEKSFGKTANIDKKYYSLEGNTMLKIQEIKQANNVKFVNDACIEAEYNSLKEFKNTDTETKLMFTIEDLQVNKAAGFYGLSYDFSDDVLQLSFDSFYIAQDYANAGWDDVLYPQLVHQIQVILASLKPVNGEVLVCLSAQLIEEAEELLIAAVELATTDLKLKYKLTLGHLLPPLDL